MPEKDNRLRVNKVKRNNDNEENIIEAIRYLKKKKTHLEWNK